MSCSQMSQGRTGKGSGGLGVFLRNLSHPPLLPTEQHSSDLVPIPALILVSPPWCKQAGGCAGVRTQVFPTCMAKTQLTTLISDMANTSPKLFFISS